MLSDAEFFRQRKDRARLERELDASHAALQASPSRRDSEVARWALLMKTIAGASPEAAAGVGRLAAQLAGPASDSRIQQTGIADRDQYNVGGRLTI